MNRSSSRLAVLAAALACLLAACGAKGGGDAPSGPVAADSTAAESSSGQADPAGNTGSGPAEPSDDPASGQASAPAGGQQPVVPPGGIVFSAEGGEAGTQLCSIFSGATISEWAGMTVLDGVPSGPMNSACAWDDADELNTVYVQMTGPDFWSPPSLAPEYRVWDGLGDESGIYAGVDEYQVWVRFEERAVVVVSVRGPAGSEAAAISVAEQLVPLAVP